MPRVELFCYNWIIRSKWIRSRQPAIVSNFRDVSGKDIFAVPILFRKKQKSYWAMFFWRSELNGCFWSPVSNRRTNFAEIATCCPPEFASVFRARGLTWHRPRKWEVFSLLWWTCTLSSRFLLCDLRRNGWSIYGLQPSLPRVWMKKAIQNYMLCAGHFHPKLFRALRALRMQLPRYRSKL